MRSVLKVLMTVTLSALIFSHVNFIQGATLKSLVPTPVQEEKTQVSMNSYEMFWPLVAGRTDGDSLYFLKTLKENVRGLLILGKAQKADYQVFLAVKRVLEAEKLTNEGNDDLARKTIDSAVKSLTSAMENLKKSSREGNTLTNVKQNISDRVVNLDKFIAVFNQGKSSNMEAKLQELHNTVSIFIQYLSSF